MQESLKPTQAVQNYGEELKRLAEEKEARRLQQEQDMQTQDPLNDKGEAPIDRIFKLGIANRMRNNTTMGGTDESYQPAISAYGATALQSTASLQGSQQ